MLKKTKPLSRKNIRDKVAIIRDICGKSRTYEFPIIHFLEFVLPKIFKDFVYDVVPDNELNCEARAYPDCYEIQIRQTVYDRAYDGNPRDLFTIAHEIGHLFLHREESISFARSNTTEIKAYENPEWQANTFAGELLAPPYLIKNLDTNEICKKCKVSQQTAEIQKSHCN